MLYLNVALISQSLSCITNYCLTSSVFLRNSHLENATAILTQTISIHVGSLDKNIHSMTQQLSKIKFHTKCMEPRRNLCKDQ